MLVGYGALCCSQSISAWQYCNGAHSRNCHSACSKHKGHELVPFISQAGMLQSHAAASASSYRAFCTLLLSQQENKNNGDSRHQPSSEPLPVTLPSCLHAAEQKQIKAAYVQPLGQCSLVLEQHRPPAATDRQTDSPPLAVALPLPFCQQNGGTPTLLRT